MDKYTDACLRTQMRWRASKDPSTHGCRRAQGSLSRVRVQSFQGILQGLKGRRKSHLFLAYVLILSGIDASFHQAYVDVYTCLRRRRNVHAFTRRHTYRNTQHTCRAFRTMCGGLHACGLHGGNRENDQSRPEPENESYSE